MAGPVQGCTTSSKGRYAAGRRWRGVGPADACSAGRGKTISADLPFVSAHSACSADFLSSVLVPRIPRVPRTFFFLFLLRAFRVCPRTFFLLFLFREFRVCPRTFFLFCPADRFLHSPAIRRRTAVLSVSGILRSLASRFTSPSLMRLSSISEIASGVFGFLTSARITP